MSGGSSGEDPAARVVAGGSLSDGDDGGALHGCRASPAAAQFDGDISERLQLGQVYDRFIAALPFGSLPLTGALSFSPPSSMFTSCASFSAARKALRR